MDINPLHWARRLAHEVKTGAEQGLHDVGSVLPSGIRRRYDWWVTAAGDVTGANSPSELVERVKLMLGSPPPEEVPLMKAPDVHPMGKPVALASGKSTEVLSAVPQGDRQLTQAHDAIAVPIDLSHAGEGQLTVRAAGPGTDWGARGRESAVLSVFVDGKHNQDIVLYRGASPADYKVALGPLSAGHHVVTLAYDRKGSTPGARGVTLFSAQAWTSADDPQGFVEKYQPFFFGRGTGTENNHDDTPLYMWATTEKHGADTVISYNVIHSNEDGGTGANPQMEQVTWGRMTDPDPICTVTVGPDGKVKQTTFDGNGDLTFNFHGSYEGGTHPILRVSTTNNDYLDRGRSRFLFRPRVQLEHFAPGTGREDLMDQNPWMYQISNEEVRREGKVMTDAQARQMLAHEGQPGFKVPRQIEDARDYLYVEYGTDQGISPLAVEVKLKGQDRWYRSDLGNSGLDIGGVGLPKEVRHLPFSSHYETWLKDVGIDLGDRSGDGIRTAVALPPGTRASDVQEIRIVNDGHFGIGVTDVAKAFMLDTNYQPQYLNLPPASGTTTPGNPLEVTPEGPAP